MALTGIDVKIEHGAGSGSTETRPRGSTGVSSEHPRLPGRNKIAEQPKPNRKSFSAKLKGVVANGQNRVPSEKDGFEGEMLISSRKNAILCSKIAENHKLSRCGAPFGPSPRAYRSWTRGNGPDGVLNGEVEVKNSFFP